jgi:hypothetical protein
MSKRRWSWPVNPLNVDYPPRILINGQVLEQVAAAVEEKHLPVITTDGYDDARSYFASRLEAIK